MTLTSWTTRIITNGNAQSITSREFIIEVYLEPNHLSGRELALKLGVAASTLSRVLKGTNRVSPEMALRLFPRPSADP